MGRELVAQLLPAPVQPRHHGTDRDSQDLGDFLVRVALDIGQVDHRAEPGRQSAERLDDLGAGQPPQCLCLRRPDRLGQPVHRDLQLVEVAAQRLVRLAAPLATGVEEGGRQDAVQPGPQVGTRRELVEGGVCPGQSVLDEVLGIAAVAGHAERRMLELRREGKDVPLEPDMIVSGLAGLTGHCSASGFSCVKRS
jgi:hypothetical protein